MTDALAPLVVIDRLEVGPVEVATDRLKAPYRVTRGGVSEETELAYRWEVPVFDPDSWTSRNLAALIAAQVALNYGLFCREIVFHGPFRPEDRRFLEEMARNTAREILVKKILQPNEFLKEPATGIEAERRESYLQAELVFPDLAAPPAAANDGGAGWSATGDRIAVLASGGKDSLLSLGLLEELGFETHSVFVNESGRHWYTALNAYRYLRSERPERTSRVWTSSDRVFGWMLKRLPFIREDHARVRSDEYPVRLWTVAVFLFGVLPVLRKRGIGRVVIGDEYDTTRRTAYRGITHYDGLYDQSRYFDNVLTRFYRRKGWPLVQFSLLRQMSEMLIEKVLAERYPHLLHRQVSCHAAHLDGDRVVPCGRCEKCRRIVGMLTALGVDPSACGYAPQQIAACLAALSERGAHQEAEGIRHLLWELVRQERIDPGGAASASAREHPEIMKLRFDRERAPAACVPADIRKGLVPILLEHSDGAVRRTGRMWVPFDTTGDPALGRPYPFEKPAMPGSPRTGGEKGAGREQDGYLLGEMTWPEAQRRLRTTDTAMLPVGACEQHGPHLPLDTDAWDADYLCRQVAARCSDPKPLVLPSIPYGVSYHHMDFSGTLSVGPDTLSRLVYEIGMSAARHGVTKFLIINGHGGNIPTLQYAAQMINRDAHIFTCVDTGDTSDADISRLTETPNDVHAGEVETSTSLAARPHLVKMKAARRFVPKFSNQYLDFSSMRSVEWNTHTARISPTGVLGDPTVATREKGERMWEIMIDHLVSFVERLKSMTLDEIHARRF